MDRMRWLDANLTNAIHVDSRLQQAKKLQQWVDKQPTSTLFSWLPSFEELELSRESYDNYGEDSSRAVLSTNKTQLFVFQGKPFILSHGETKNRFEALKIRVFWGSTKPIRALLEAVCQSETLKVEAPLMISTVWHDYTERDEAIKRPLSLIDMAPEEKKWLLNDLKTFFAKDSMAYYRMNGTPYRRGYLLYGPPGTGKTSLAQAIASDYDLELFEIKLAKITDATLQQTFKDLPPRCVVLFEDIDAAGIGREDLVQAEKASNQAKKQVENQDAWNGRQDYEDYRGDLDAYYPSEEINVAPDQSFVTLSGLLNALDGPGAKEGRFVIMTTNSPKSLDKAVFRRGRIDKVMYLGYSCPESAACTFKRMFGTDLTFPVPEDELGRLAKLFSKIIPGGVFTPCEIAYYCREHRGKPRKAIKNFRNFTEDRIMGKDQFLYDIKDEGQETQPQEHGNNEDEIAKRLSELPDLSEADAESVAEDEDYSSLDDGNFDSALDDLSLPRPSSKLEKSSAPRLRDTPHENGEKREMVEADDYLPPDWLYLGCLGL